MEIRKDGSRFWALAVIDAVKDDAGKLIGFAKVTRDLTERQLAQQSLIDSERSYRQLIESVVDYAIFQLDANGIVTTWNPGAERIKGYKAREIIGRHFSCFYTAEDQEAGVPQVALATAAREGRYEAEAFRVRKDGSRLFASVIIDPIRGDDGKIIGFAKVTRDITEKMEAQRALKEARTALRFAEDGSCRPAKRRDSTRLQQSNDDRAWQSGIGSAKYPSTGHQSEPGTQHQ